MIAYPQNQIYCIVPVQNVVKLIGEVLDVARSSIDKKFIVWHYLETDPALDKLKANVNIKLLSHAETLKLMASKEWAAKELDYFSSSNE